MNRIKNAKMYIIAVSLFLSLMSGTQPAAAKDIKVDTQGSVHFIVKDKPDEGDEDGDNNENGNGNGGTAGKPDGKTPPAPSTGSGGKEIIFPQTGELLSKGLPTIGFLLIGAYLWSRYRRKNRSI